MEDADCGENTIPDSESKPKENTAAVNNSGGDKEHSLMNGLSNGYNDKHKKDKHKDKHKEKHRDSDRDKDKHRDKHKEHRDKEKDRDRDKEKDRDKDKDRDRHKHSSSSSSKDKEKDKSRYSSSSSSKDKEREKDKERDKEKERDKDKERKDKDKYRDDKDRKDKDHKTSSSSNKDKEHKSSSSSKHISSSSSKDKDRHSSSHSSSKDKHSSDKHRSDKDKDRHSSSKDKDKDRHGSDRKERDRHKDKEKSKDKTIKEEKSGIQRNSSESNVSKIKDEPMDIELSVKQESFTNMYNDSKLEIKEEVSIKEEMFYNEENDDDDDEGKMVIKEEMDDSQDMIYKDQSLMKESINNSTVMKSEEDEDDVPLTNKMARGNKTMSRKSNIKKEFFESDDEDDVPLMARKKSKKPNKKRKMEESDGEEDFKPVKKKKPPVKKEKQSIKTEATPETSPRKKKKQEDEPEVWKWWEEEKKADGVKWNFLEHKGPVFAPDYERLPPNVKFFYDGDEMRLSQDAEEVATFYAKMLDHDYTTKEAFNENFFKDWRKIMSDSEKEKITKLSKCNFKQMHAYFVQKSEERKAMSKEEKKAIKDQNEEITKEYGFCTIDGHKEKIGNFRIEPPGLFRGRGEHPKMGKLKKRVLPEHVLINCSRESKIPQAPKGHKWKEVRHDNTVTWLCSWTENVQGQVKYVMLNPSSKLKGEKDWQKYETARKLAKSIDKIREEYRADWKSKEMRIRQRAVAMYFIDKLALRAGNEKDEDQADTVGCCSLRVEHIQLHEEKDGKEYVVVFDFLGKDSIRYYNEVPVEKRVFKNLQLFVESKKGNDDLFDRLNTTVLNKYLNELMEGLSAKVFRTYNASWTLQQQLKELTDPDAPLAEKVLAYNRANRAVAVLCNHQRSVPKTHQKSMENLKEKIGAKKQLIEEAEKNYKYAKKDAKNGSAKEKIQMEKCKKTLERLKEQLLKLEVQETDREENKSIALGTSKLNYLDPRISVAWCKKFDVPIEKIYNKTQRDKFRWAIDMAGPDYIF